MALKAISAARKTGYPKAPVLIAGKAIVSILYDFESCKVL